ncbi:CD36 family protein [Cooperia oncophora]
MANPPIKNVMRFFFFNVSNPDEIIYNNEKPRLIETQSYAVMETEQKRYLKWSEDGTKIFYENYKTYVISDEYTCPECSWDDTVTIPNTSGVVSAESHDFNEIQIAETVRETRKMLLPYELVSYYEGAAADLLDPQYNLTKVAQKLLGFGLLLLGEYPFISHTVKEILFDGYNDALLDVGHSQIVYVLSGILNGGKSIIPIPIPDMPRLGFFQGYNNSRDESYWVESGKDDINRLGEIVTWANQTILPQSWWPTAYARSIRGSGELVSIRMRFALVDLTEMAIHKELPVCSYTSSFSFISTYQKQF